MYKNTQSDIRKLIEVNIPIIYIQDFDFVRVDEILDSIIKSKDIKEWNPATGVTNFKNRLPLSGSEGVTLVQYLREIYTNDFDDNVREKFIVLREIHDYIENPEVKALLSLIAQRKLYDRQFETTIIIVSSVKKVPEEIQNYVTFIDIEYPQKDEINKLIDEYIEVNGYKNFEEEDREKLMPSLQGLTAYEIDRILDMAMSNNGTLDADDKEMILKQKKGMVKKSGLLELVDTPENIESIGGLDDLKNYLQLKSKIFHNLSEAIKYGVSMPMVLI